MANDRDPTIARFGPFEYRYRQGQLEWRLPGREWTPDAYPPEAYAAVAALKDHPTDDDEAAA